MADFIKIADRMYEGASTDTKPSDVPNGTICRYTNTREVVITYDHGVTWINADKRVRVVTKTGAIYENQDTASDDTARRFETSEKKLIDIVIKVETYGQYFGTSSNQRLLLEANDTMGFTYADISTLYFKNKTAGENGVVTILGVEE